MGPAQPVSFPASGFLEEEEGCHGLAGDFEIVEDHLVALDIGSLLAMYKHCDLQIGSEPVLVPPTWNDLGKGGKRALRG